MIYACPRCEKSDGLYRDVEGWQPVTSELIADKSQLGSFGKNVYDVVPTGHYGCACGFEGFISDLLKIGPDGKPLNEEPVEQQTLL